MKTTMTAVLVLTAVGTWAGDGKSGDCPQGAKTAAAAPAEKSGAKAEEKKAEPVTAQAAFEGLKSLVGHWEAPGPGPEAPKMQVSYRMISNGSTLMETMLAGTPHEMITMYHLDGGDLVLTHYCAAGNQPKMKLDLEASTAKNLRFAFAGGSNISESSMHMHDGSIRLIDADHVEAEWTTYKDGKPEAGSKVFALARKR
jgi:hypothetical protein